MKEFAASLRNHYKAMLITFFSVLAGDVLLYVLYCFVLVKPSYKSGSDGGFIFGLTTVGVGLLMLVGHLGMFDLLAYGISSFGKMFFNGSRYKDLIEYRDIKEEKRRRSAPYYFPVIIAGLLITIVGIIFEIIFTVNLAPAA